MAAVYVAAGRHGPAAKRTAKTLTRRELAS